MRRASVSREETTDGRPYTVRVVFTQRSRRDRHRRRRAGTDRSIRDRPALATARGRLTDLDRRALNQARLSVRDDLLPRLEPLRDDRVVALVPHDDDGRVSTV